MVKDQTPSIYVLFTKSFLFQFRHMSSVLQPLAAILSITSRFCKVLVKDGEPLDKLKNLENT